MKEELIKLAYKLGFEEVIYPLNDKDYFIFLCLLQKWLREKHGINISIRQLNLHGGEVEYNDFIYLKGKNNHEQITLGNEFDTYEQALENAIFQSLKLIKK